MRRRASAIAINQLGFRNSARWRPLNASKTPLSVGLPGRLKSISTPITLAHRLSAFVANLGLGSFARNEVSVGLARRRRLNEHEKADLGEFWSECG